MELERAILEMVRGADHRLSIDEVANTLNSSMGIEPKRVKRSLNELVFDGRLEFSFYGRSYVELPIKMCSSHH